MKEIDMGNGRDENEEQTRQWDEIARLTQATERLSVQVAKTNAIMETHVANATIHQVPPCDTACKITTRIDKAERSVLGAACIAILGLLGALWGILSGAVQNGQ